MENTVKKYLSVLLDGANANLSQMDEYISNTETQLKEITAKRAEIMVDVEELVLLVGDYSEESSEDSSEEK